MIIRKEFLRSSTRSRPGYHIEDVKAIVIHWVGKSRETADAVKKYFDNLPPDVYASAHYSINDTNIIQMIPDDEVAYHVGSWVYTDLAKKKFGELATSNKNMIGSTPNFYTIGIELNHLNDDGLFSHATEESAAELTSNLCRLYGLNPQTDVLRHYDITGKLCPKWYVLHEMDWDLFIGRVQEYYEGNT